MSNAMETRPRRLPDTAFDTCPETVTCWRILRRNGISRKDGSHRFRHRRLDRPQTGRGNAVLRLQGVRGRQRA